MSKRIAPCPLELHIVDHNVKLACRLDDVWPLPGQSHAKVPGSGAWQQLTPMAFARLGHKHPEHATAHIATRMQNCTPAHIANLMSMAAHIICKHQKERVREHYYPLVRHEYMIMKVMADETTIPSDT